MGNFFEMEEKYFVSGTTSIPKQNQNRILGKI